jgi:catechol 2,3-dioxygenase-like lactoylglutathione lyase family enzyme
VADFIPRRDVQGISHVNVVVDDIEVATEFYRTVPGFEQAASGLITGAHPISSSFCADPLSSGMLTIYRKDISDRTVGRTR